MIFSENRCTLFRIMREGQRSARKGVPGGTDVLPSFVIPDRE
jgi:hypothetical protein